MLRYAILIFIANALCIGIAYAEIDKGVVVLDHYTCNTYDRIVIETTWGYTSAEVYSGYGATYEGNVILGDFNSFGFTNFFDTSGNERGRLYIDNYWLGEDEATEWCYE